MKSIFSTSLATLGLAVLAACSSSTSPAGGTAGSSGSSGSSGAGGSSGSSGSGGSSGSSGSSSNPGTPTVTSMCAPAKVTYGVAMTATLAASSSPDTQTFVVADLDNDGAADLIATDRSALDVALSKKDGTFGAPKSIPATPGNNAAITAADFDGDGNMDILTGSFGTGSVDDSIDCFLGDGKGGFKIPVNTGIIGEALYEFQVADFNGDGKPDLYFVGTAGQAGIVLNAGGGSFAGPGIALNVDGAGDVLAFGDFDGDKAADLAFFDSNQNSMCTAKNGGTGSFGKPVCYPATANLAATFARVADLNGDGKPDVVLLNENGDNGGDAINVWINKGDGTFADRVAYSFQGTTSAFAVVDVNNDHKPDLVISQTFGGGQLTLIPNNGDGTFTTTSPVTMAFGGESASAHTPLGTGDFLANGLVGFAAFKDSDGHVNVITTSCKP